MICAARLTGLLTVAVIAAAASGCSLLGAVTGAAAGIATGAGTANPALAVGVAIGVKAVVDDAVKTVQRRLSHDEQQAIADAAGRAAVGERQGWEVRHAIPYRETQGEVIVLASRRNALTQCKEASFTLAGSDGESSQPFVTTVCRSGDGWHWAAAEPAVPRWGALQ